jgi:GntR family transcriptional regulator/MocR family aminotransferase
MTKRRLGPLFGSLERGSGRPLHRTLYETARDAILAGSLAPGERLPSTRVLARDLGVSRTTALAAFEQLAAEGYVTSRTGSGTRVAEGVATLPPPPRPGRRRPSSSGRHLHHAPRPERPVAFAPGLPALDQLPLALWSRTIARCTRRATPEQLGYGHPLGEPRLRKAIARHAAAARGVRCDWEQVVVLTSAQQGIDLVARVTLEPGDRVWLEDPGYPGAVRGLASRRLELLPLPVDGSGARTPNGPARLCYVTPSHQYPLGVAMSLERRLALLDWAHTAGALVVEDDYDSEFRLRGRPLQSLHGLDKGGHVLYMGTFSKLLFPSLRIAYLIVPGALVTRFEAARHLTDGHSATLPQIALAELLESGQLAAHVRRMRDVYSERREALVAAVRERLADRLELSAGDTGLHAVGYLTGHSDIALSRRAAAAGLDLKPLSRYYRRRRAARSGFVLGYGGVPPEQIRSAVGRMAELLPAEG